MIHVVVGQTCECTLKVNEYTSLMDKICFKDYDTCSHTLQLHGQPNLHV
jgi:hypothetical protein